jgi:hypothetical protein
MADIRIKDLATTASTTASDDFMAVDGTTNGTRKLSAATPSFATSVTVPGVSAPASTALTLAGGSTGASLVLGHGTTQVTTHTGKQVDSFNRATFSTVDSTALAAGIGGGISFGGVFTGSTATTWAGVFGNKLNATDGNYAAYLAFATRLNGANLSEKARLTDTGNLLIGTTTDAASLAGGLIVNGSGAGATSSSTDTGALRVTGGVGVTGAVNVGGAATFAGAVTASGNLLVTGGSKNFRLRDTGITDANYDTLSFQAYDQNVFSIGVGSLAGTPSQIRINGATNAVAFTGAVSGITTLSYTGGTTATSTGNHVFGTTNTVIMAAGALTTTGAATFGGAVAIGNTTSVAVAAASTHKVSILIGGVQYYLLASNV